MMLVVGVGVVEGKGGGCGMICLPRGVERQGFSLEWIFGFGFPFPPPLFRSLLFPVLFSFRFSLFCCRTFFVGTSLFGSFFLALALSFFTHNVRRHTCVPQ